MEIAQLNNNSNLYGVNSYTLSNPNKIEKTSDTGIRDVIDVEQIQSSNRIQSEFAGNLSNNITQLSQIQNNQNTVTQQLSITSKIVQVVKQAVSSESPSQALDNIQPQVQTLINNYNDLEKDNSTLSKINSIIEEKNNENSRSYFDGTLGSKPLSHSEIFAAVDKQRELLTTNKTNLSNEFEQVVKDTKDIIQKERVIVEEKMEFKVVNFGQESAQFNNNSIANIEGSIVSSQPNASQQQSFKLLV